MTIISVIFTLLTMITSVGIYYGMFRNQVISDLKTHVHILKTTQAVLEYIEKDYDPRIDNLRITVINVDGSVEYDSNADVGIMDNHINRPEIQDVLKNGYGSSVRESGTLARNTYYYAEKFDENHILRVAKEAGNLWQFCLEILPIFLVVLGLAVLVSLIVAKVLAKSLIKPIELVAQNLENENSTETYEEIQPFIDKIHSQHKDLKKSSKMRQEFTANVSHELKTPLASISGYAELIETGMAKEGDIQHFASEIHKSANRLLSLINDIIELSQLDVMDNQLFTININLTDEVKNCVNTLKMNAEKHNITITTDVIEEDCIITANQEMIEEIIYNLCDNAIRYNKQDGHVWVSVFEKDDNIVLQVKDDGIGIAEEDLDRIFERFYRVDKARSKKTGGTGLGLAIVKHIAEQHDAKILIDSKLGEGTTISVLFEK